MRVTDTEYLGHRVFAELQRYSDFYDWLAMSVFPLATMGTGAICNIDTYVFSSMRGTVESMRTVLLAGRVNDAYSLLRKYYDVTVINAYSNLYLQDHFSLDNFVVEKIHRWLHGKEKLPRYGRMAQYLRDSELLGPMITVLDNDRRYEAIRIRCNDHIHYNFYRYAMLNDNEVGLGERGQWLDQFSLDALDVFVLHCAYTFFLNDIYMMSSDYVDALDCGLTPEEGSQYWVAPYVQQIFDEIITPRRPDVTATIKAKSAMQLL